MSSESTIQLTVPVEGTKDQIEVEFELKELADLIAEKLSKPDLDLFIVYLNFARVSKLEKLYEEQTGKKFSFNEET